MKDFVGKYGVLIDVLTCLVFLGVTGVIELTVEPFKRDFLLDDIDIGYPFQDDTVSTAVLMVCSLLIPVAGFFLVHVLLNAYFGRRRTNKRLAFRILGMVEAFIATFVLTEILKLSVGRLRPDFLARCEWSYTFNKCMGNEEDILDGRKSFPSGHSSTAFACMTYLTFYLAFELDIYQSDYDKEQQKQQLQNLKNQQQGQNGEQDSLSPHERQPALFTRMMIALSPIFVAIIIAVSRIWDNKHHPGDVIGGALIGTAASYLVFAAHHQHGHQAEETSVSSSYSSIVGEKKALLAPSRHPENDAVNSV